MSDFKPDHIIVHCAATPVHMTQVDAAWVDAEHRRKGWLMCGYHEVITLTHGGVPPMRQRHIDGYRTRPIDRVGSHVGGCGRGWNNRCIGISLAGGVDRKGNPEDNFEPEQIRLLMEAIREYQAEYDIPDERVMGHRDLIRQTNAAPKACPCFSVSELLTGQRAGGVFHASRTSMNGDPLGIPKTLKVGRGQTLWGISQTYGIPVADLQQWNGIQDPSEIHVGMLLDMRSS